MTKTLPSAIDAECSVLGCLLLDNTCYPEVAASLSVSHFFDKTNQLIFEAISKFSEEGRPFDPILLGEHFENNHAIKSLGGFTYFIQLTRMTPTTQNLSHYIDIVRSKATLRNLLVLTSKLHNEAYTPNITPQGLIMELEKFISDNAFQKSGTPFLQDANDLLKQPTAQEWLIKHWLPKDSLTMLHAKPGIGKSFLALDWALHIASTLPTWNSHIVNHGCVVYLAGEGNNGLKRRVKAWVQEKRLTDTNLPLYISSRGCKLDTPEGYNEVVAAINQLKIEPALIIVDTLHRFITGHMNDSQDAGKMIYHCDKLKEGFKSTVLLVHHVGHAEAAQTRAMGATAWVGAIDVDMHLAKKEDVLELTQNKMKDNPKAPPILFELTEVVIDGWLDSDNEPITSAILTKSNKIIREEDDAATRNAKLLFEAAWEWNGSRKTDDNKPYILRDHMLDYLVKVKNHTDNSARQLIKTSNKDRFIGLLLDKGYLKIYSNGLFQGWFIYSTDWLAACG